MSQSLQIKSQSGLVQVGRNVFLNNLGKLSNGASSLTLSNNGNIVLSGKTVLDGSIVLPHSNITQITDGTTRVEVNGNSGVITTVTLTSLAEANISFAVSNSSVVLGSVVLVSISDYTGIFTTNGIPVLAVKSVVAGGFDIVVANVHGMNALNGALKISFMIV